MSSTAQLIVKMVISGILVGLISEVAKSVPRVGGLIAGAPVTTTITLFWLIMDRAPNVTLAQFCRGVFLGLIPTSLFLFTAGTLLYRDVKFPLALAIAFAVFVVTWLIVQRVSA